MKVFVYGSLLNGLSNHRILGDSPKIKDDTITGFTMHDLGAFPALVESNDTTPIIGEVYEVNDETFKILDRLEGYPNFYTRKLVTTSVGEAWVYFCNDMKDEPIVKSGNWKEFFSENKEI